LNRNFEAEVVKSLCVVVEDPRAPSGRISLRGLGFTAGRWGILAVL
jgi:hypothetical protein